MRLRGNLAACRLARVGLNAAAGRPWRGLSGQLVERMAEAMADTYSPDSEPTTRTLLRRVLDTADTRTPQRRRSTRIGYVRALPEHVSYQKD